MINRRNTFAALAAAAFAFTAPMALAQPVLDKTVKIVVGFPPGGASDSVARLLADQLRGSYAPVVLVDNKPGGAGRLGVQAVKAGPADGS
jgi:tripartite-type tricarboxylate transporter receptor subunit TctC